MQSLLAGDNFVHGEYGIIALLIVRPAECPPAGSLVKRGKDILRRMECQWLSVDVINYIAAQKIQ